MRKQKNINIIGFKISKTPERSFKKYLIYIKNINYQIRIMDNLSKFMILKERMKKPFQKTLIDL